MHMKKPKTKTKKNRKVKTIPYNTRTSRDIAIPDFKLNYRAIVIKPVGYWHKKQTDESMKLN